MRSEKWSKVQVVIKEMVVLNVILLLLLGFSQAIEYECPKGWLTFDMSCYRFVSSPLLPAEGAKASCARDGASLVEISTTQEHNWVVNRIIELTETIPTKPVFYTNGKREDNTDAYRWGSGKGDPVETDEFWLYLDVKKEGQLAGNTYIVYTYNATVGKWGWNLARGDTPQSYICEIPRAEAFKIRVENRNFDFGIENPPSDPDLWNRGPKFTKQPKNVIFFKDSGHKFASFDCVASGYPAPQYYWNRTRQNDKLKIDPMLEERYTITNGKLTIYQPNENADYGTYQCVTFNQYGSILSEKAELKFGYINDFPRTTREPVSKSAYSGAAIDCNPPTASPNTLLYQWYKGSSDNFLNTNLKPYLFISNSGKLLFSYITKEDEGDYTCIVSHSGEASTDNKISQPIRLNVATGVSSVKEPAMVSGFPNLFPKNALRGDDVRLECFAWGTNDLVYKWSKVGGTLPRNTRVADQGRVLNIPNIQLEDRGTYQCIVTRKQGQSASGQVTVSLAASPYFSNFNTEFTDQFADRDTDVQWKCDASGDPAVEYKWYRNSDVLIAALLNADQAARYAWNAPNNNILTISKVMAADEAMYQCAATNLHGTKYVTGQLKVYGFKPIFTKSPLSDRYAVIGGNATFTCSPEASPSAQITWLKNGVDVNPVENPDARVQRVGGSNLFIKTIEQNDQGKYTCFAKNSFGEARSEAQLTILDRPRFQQLPLDEDIGFNRTQMLRCRGNPGPILDVVYVWKHNTRIINLEGNPELNPPDPNYERGVGTRDGYLIIKNTTFATGGDYSCVFTTPVSELSWPLNVKIYGPPGPPAGIQAILKTGFADRMVITWFKGGENNRPITKYRVEGINNHNPGVWEVLKEAPATSTLSMEVDNLNPWTSYNFRVRAQNEVGWGEPSGVSNQVTTPTRAPDVVPLNVGGGGGKVGTLVIAWNRIPPVKQFGPGISYKVYYRRLGGSETDWEEKIPPKGNINRHVETLGATDNNIYKQFEVKVKAYNDVGDGPESPKETIYSAEGLPNERPQNVRVEQFNMTALRVFWIPVPDTVDTMKGVLAGYRISYWKTTENQNLALRKTYYGQRRSGIITGLRPKTMYYISVQVFNTAGNGDFAEQFPQETLRPSPRNMPEDAKVYAATQTSVKLTWRGVSTTPNEEPLTGYMVRYWKGSETIHKNIIITVGRKTYAEITGLEPGETYNFRVMGYSRGGNGKMSSPMITIYMIKDACEQGYHLRTTDNRVTVRCSSCLHMVSYSLVSLIMMYHILERYL